MIHPLIGSQTSLFLKKTEKKIRVKFSIFLINCLKKDNFVGKEPKLFLLNGVYRHYAIFQLPKNSTKEYNEPKTLKRQIW